jgi:hypothetical protein
VTLDMGDLGEVEEAVGSLGGKMFSAAKDIATPAPALPARPLAAGEPIAPPRYNLTTNLLGERDAKKSLEARTQTNFTDQEFQYAIAAKATLGDGLSDADAMAVARRLTSLFGEAPFLEEMADQDFLAMIQLSEADEARRRITSFDTPTDAMYVAALDMLNQHKDVISTTEAAIYAAENLADYGVYNLQNVATEGVQSLDSPLVRGIAERSDDPLASLGVIADLQGKDRTVRVMHLPDDNRIVLTATYDDGTEETLVDAILDDGVKIKNADEAMLEGLLAWDGTAHQTLSRSDSKGRQSLFGLLVNEPMGMLTDFLLEVPGTQTAMELIGGVPELLVNRQVPEVHLTLASDRDGDRKAAQEMATAQAKSAVDSFDRWDLLVKIAQAEYATGRRSPVEAARESSEFVSAMSDDEFLMARGDILDSKELRKTLLEAQDDRNSIEQAFDGTMMTAARGLDYYDWVIHHGFLTIAALTDGTMDLIIPGDDTFRSYGEAFKAVVEADDTADYFSLEPDSSEAHSTNLFVSLAFDPSLWVTPGGKGLAQVAMRRMTTKAGAAEAIALPTSRHAALKTAQAIENSEDAIAIVARHANMDPSYKLKLIDGTVQELAAREGIPLNEAVEKIMLESLPANGGTNILDMTGHAVTRNSARAAALVARSSDDKVVGSFLRRTLGVFRQQRQVSLSGGFVGDMEETIFAIFRNADDATKAQANELLRDVYRTYDDFLHGGSADRLADLRAQVSNVYGDWRRLAEDVSPQARRFATLEQKVVRAETRLREIELALPGADDAGRASLLAEKEGIVRGAELIPVKKREVASLNAKIKRRQDKLDRLDDLTPQDQDLINAEIESLTARSKAAKEELVSLKDNALPMSSESEVYQGLRTEYEAYRAGLSGLRDQRQRYRRLIAEAGQAGNRDALDAGVERLYYNIGERLRAKGLIDYAPEIGDGVFDTYPLTGKRMHDWTPLTGEKKAWPARTTEEGVSIRESIETILTDPENITREQRQLLDNLDATGLGALRGSTPVPASPYEIVMFEEMGAKKWAQYIDHKMNPGRIRTAANAVQRIWVSSLLLNARTMVKSNMDEFYSLAMDTGRSVGRRRGATGLGGEFGDELLYSTIPAPLEAGVRSLFSGPSDRAIASEFSRSFGITTESPFARTSAEGYDVFQPGKKGHDAAARWQINGVIANDPVSQKVAAAMAAGDPGLFTRWWEEEGFLFARTGHWKQGQAIAPVTAETAWSSREAMFDVISGYVPEAKRGKFRQSLIDSIANQSNMSSAQLRLIDHPISGPSILGAGTKKGDRRKATEWAFDIGYGSPGGNRASLVHQEYQSQYLEMLYRAKEENGTLLTADRLAEWMGNTPGEANALLRNAPESVIAQMRAGGMWTPGQLEAIADQMARRRATSMMFQPGAASFLGKKFQRVYPFGPAQADFLSRWGLAYTEAATVGLNPSLQRGLKKIPGVKKLVNESTPFFGKPVQVSAGGRALPLNLRLLGRSLALGGSAAHQQLPQLEEKSDRVDNKGALAAVEAGSFFPLSFDEMFIVDVVPQIGGVPSYFLSWLPLESDEDDPGWYRSAEVLRDMAEGISPTMKWNPAYALGNLPGSMFDAFAQTMVPRGPTTVRGQAEAIDHTMMGLFAQIAPGLFGGLAQQTAVLNSVVLMSRPMGWTRAFKSNLGDVLAENGSALPAFGSHEYRELYGGVIADTFAATGTNSFARTAKKSGAFWLSPNDFDGEYARHWEGIVDLRGNLLAIGAIGDDRAITLNDLWEKANSADADRDAAEDFVDYASDIYFNLDSDTQDLLLANFPGMAVNAVGSYAPTLGGDGLPIHEEYTTTGGKLLLPFGEEGRAILERGVDEGWIRRKSDEEIMRDVSVRLNDAYRGVSSSLWGRTFTNEDGEPATWRGEASVLDNDRAKTVTISDSLKEAWATVGVHIPGNTVTDKELAVMLQTQREIWSGHTQRQLVGSLTASEIMRKSQAALADPEQPNVPAENAMTFMRNLELLEKKYDADGINRFSDWTAKDQQDVRDGMKYLMDFGLLHPADYNNDFAARYGDPNWTPPDPPSWSDLPTGAIMLDSTEAQNIHVIDGDTVLVTLPSGDEARVRLLGVNAADSNSVNADAEAEYHRQTENLKAAIRLADSVGFAVYDPVRFGTVQEFADGGERFLMFMYLDGEPVIDPNIFSDRNPVGRKPTGDGIPDRYFMGDSS